EFFNRLLRSCAIKKPMWQTGYGPQHRLTDERATRHCRAALYLVIRNTWRARAKAFDPNTVAWVFPAIALVLSGLAERGRMVKGEYHDFFPGGGADVLMQTNDHCAGCFLNHLHHNRPRLFNQLSSDLLEEISPFF